MSRFQCCLILKEISVVPVCWKQIFNWKLDPTGQLQGSCVSTFEALTTTSMPVSLFLHAVFWVQTIATAAMEARRSPWILLLWLKIDPGQFLIFRCGMSFEWQLASVSDIPDVVNYLNKWFSRSLYYYPDVFFHPHQPNFQSAPLLQTQALYYLSCSYLVVWTESGKSFITSASIKIL